VFVDRIGCLSECLFHDTPELLKVPHGAGCAVEGGPSRGALSKSGARFAHPN
jgi:hypothetical protein